MKYHKYYQKIQKTDKLSTFNFDIFISYYFNIYTLQFLFANGYMNQLTNTHQMGIIGLCRRSSSTLLPLLQASSIRTRPAMPTATGLSAAMACVR